jgi:hypothetical protein
MSRKHRSPVWKVSSEEFREIIDQSDTMRQVLSHFGLESKGSNHITVKNRCKEEGIGLSGLKERSLRFVAEKSAVFHQAKQCPIEDILVENSSYSRFHLKKRLLATGLLQDICHKCGMLPEWEGDPLVMVLDHINGVPDDNRIGNLRLLCPNCNSQTLTFSGRNKRREKVVSPSIPPQPQPQTLQGHPDLQLVFPLSVHQVGHPVLCSECGCEIGRGTKNEMCFSCFSKGRRKVERPSKDELQALISHTSMVKIGQQYGVSDGAVRKWAKSYGLL